MRLILCLLPALFAPSDLVSRAHCGRGVLFRPLPARL